MAQLIDTRAAAGGVEYTWPLTITENTPVDISADPVSVSLGSYSTPGDWLTPDTDVPGADAAGITAGVQNQRTVQLLIGADYQPDPGDYWLWSKVGDSPEVVPRRHSKITIC